MLTFIMLLLCYSFYELSLADALVAYPVHVTTTVTVTLAVRAILTILVVIVVVLALVSSLPRLW